VTGPFGHTLQFSYDEGEIVEVEDPAGETIAYAYDTDGNLSEVTYQDSSSKTYHYENTTFPHHLTGITDENNVRFATYAYDSEGRVISSEHAGGAGAISIEYNEDESVVTDAAGTVITFEFTTDSAYARRAISVSRNGLTTAYTVASHSSDPQRRVTQSTDPRGTVTTFTYDRDHLTSMTEAYGTALERTTEYEYHSDEDDLPTEVTEPNRVMTFTYN
jgi:YD repeat-containing protein